MAVISGDPKGEDPFERERSRISKYPDIFTGPKGIFPPKIMKEQQELPKAYPTDRYPDKASNPQRQVDLETLRQRISQINQEQYTGPKEKPMPKKGKTDKGGYPKYMQQELNKPKKYG